METVMSGKQAGSVRESLQHPTRRSSPEPTWGWVYSVADVESVFSTTRSSSWKTRGPATQALASWCS